MENKSYFSKVAQTLILLISLGVVQQAAALPIAIKKNVFIRNIQNGRAVLKNNSKGFYILKSGSVIDLPDRFIVRNSSGQIDIDKSLAQWMKQDKSARSYKIENADHQVVGEDQFFRLIVLQAAPGSNIPAEEPYIALGFLNRSRAITPVEANSVSALPNQAPIPESRPQPEPKAATPPSEEQQYGRPSLADSSFIDMSGSNSGTQDPTSFTTSPSPEKKLTRAEIDDNLAATAQYADQNSNTPQAGHAGPTKQQILNANSDRPTNSNPTYYESGKIERREISLPKQAPAPTVKPAENAAIKAEEAAEATGVAGNADEICPQGNCGVYDSGKEDDTDLFCKQTGAGGFPQNLNKLSNGSSGKKILRVSLKWNSLAMREPKNCDSLCKFESSGLARLLDSREQSHKSYCDRIEKCVASCNTSRLIPKTKCSTEVIQQTKHCKDHCSPYLGLDSSKRNIHLKSVFADMSGDLEQFNPEFSNQMKSNGFFTSMPSRLLCLNRRRENVDLEPLARNCSSSAIGVGQVLKGSFYYTLGLANKTQQKSCLNIPIKDLKSKCKGWDKNSFRKSAYWKYMDFTPKELYDIRTIDAELQARSSYAVFLDKLRLADFNLNKAYRGYFGKSDSKAINRIEKCVRTGQ